MIGQIGETRKGGWTRPQWMVFERLGKNRGLVRGSHEEGLEFALINRGTE